MRELREARRRVSLHEPPKEVEANSDGSSDEDMYWWLPAWSLH